MDNNESNSDYDAKIRVLGDQSYRTCAECGGDCIPEPSGADELGIRLMFVCPQHGVHAVVDPFKDKR